MAHQQSDAELVAHLAEQVAFLRQSAAQYDEGVDAEAKRLAVSVRTMCHDTRNSQSLLHQLGLLDVLRFVDTAWQMPMKREPEREPGTVMVTAFSSPLAPMSGGPRGYTPLLDTA